MVTRLTKNTNVRAKLSTSQVAQKPVTSPRAKVMKGLFWKVAAVEAANGVNVGKKRRKR